MNKPRNMHINHSYWRIKGFLLFFYLTPFFPSVIGFTADVQLGFFCVCECPVLLKIMRNHKDNSWKVEENLTKKKFCNGLTSMSKPEWILAILITFLEKWILILLRQTFCQNWKKLCLTGICTDTFLPFFLSLCGWSKPCHRNDCSTFTSAVFRVC